MKYNLLYTRSAFKDIKSLDLISKKRIRKIIEPYSARPIFHAKKLIHSSIGTYRWRAGQYRIVFDTDGKNLIILRIGHRREIYK